MWWNSGAQYGGSRSVVGEATVFVSHGWKCGFEKAVEVMLEYAESHPEAYFWFDLFVNNQNIASNIPHEWWRTTFKESIEQIGSVLVVMTPWQSPVPPKRAWCLWEILCNKTTGAQLTIAMSDREKERLVETLTSDYQEIKEVNL